MNLKEFVSSARTRLAPLYGPEEAKAMALRLLDHFGGVPSYKYLSEPELSLKDAGIRDEAALAAALDGLCTGRPLQYVLGVAEFCGHRFKVREGCLIPRPETEELVVMAADDIDSRLQEADLSGEPFNILDICTGSGCIAWSLAAEFPEAMVYGCDISEDALATACRQRIKLQGAKPVFFSADVLSDPPAGLPQFDVIIANPPYICESERSAMRPNVLDFEPALALFVPDSDPLVFYRAIAKWCSSLLKEDGALYLEINERFGAETVALFPGSSVCRDVAGKERFVLLKKFAAKGSDVADGRDSD